MSRHDSQSKPAMHLLAFTVLGVTIGIVRVGTADDRVMICHHASDTPNNYQTISIAPSAVPGHLAHGDLPGTCQSDCSALLCDDNNACTTDTGIWVGGSDGDGRGHCLCKHAPVSCGDNNRCTADSCDPQRGCVNTPVPGRPCNDGNVCTTNDTCDATGQCNGAARNCDDHNPCTDDSCDPTTGCVHTPVPGRACNDGNACTTNDTCNVAGQCVGGAPLNCDDGNVCTRDRCDRNRGCINRPLPGRPCDDGNACTTNDQCTATGQCVGKAASTCDDGNPCTDDSCDATGGCVHTPAPGRVCNDGDACTTNDTCDAAGQCHGTMQSCDDGNSCTDDACDPAVGTCLHTPAVGRTCDDGNACTIGDACDAAGQCSGVTRSCDDNNPCTDDACDPAVGCVHTNNTAPCDDGNACTTAAIQKVYEIDASLLDNQDSFCDGTGENRYNGCVGNYGFHWDDLGGGLGGVVRVDIEFQSGVVCDPGADHPIALNNTSIGNLTIQGACDCAPLTSTGTFSVLSGSAYIPGGTNFFSIQGIGTCEGFSDNGPFGSGIFARVTVTYAEDQCIDGQCIGGSAVTCDDNNPCTDDACDPVLGCVYTPVPGRACDDGNTCTTNDTCNPSGQCTGGLLNCDDNNACTIDSCDAISGCINAPLNCDDGNGCTDDSCDPQTGCVNRPVPGRICDDGNACTTDDTCNNTGACIAGPPANCNDTNPCTDDTCDPVSGCMFTPNDANACDDGNACTQTDQCRAGVCRGSNPIACPAQDPCHPGVCDPTTGTCSTPAVIDGTACAPDACTAGTCTGGQCTNTAPVNCDDNNVCTTDTCDPATGCIHTNVDNGTPCGTTTCQNGGCGTTHALFANGPGFNCPTGATEFSYVPPLDPSSSDQAKAACEACYGAGACFLETADCAGPGWGPSPPGNYTCGSGNAYFGYTFGCTGDDGRAWPICNSFSTYGWWGKF